MKPTFRLLTDEQQSAIAAAAFELLERVGNPRPLNPNRRLTSIAERRGWPVRRFASRGRPGVMDWARSIAATGSLVTSFAAGLPIWALTGSRREHRIFPIPCLPIPPAP